jgi:hypothetical protein
MLFQPFFLMGAIFSNALQDIHVKFTLAFPSNVGKLELLQLNLFLDGYRPTVIATLDTATTGSTVETAVFANGIYIYIYVYI